ncbi:hypothetical protein Q9L42_015400 [Methylomarinum sp. Ch1-1]|uniref:Uncharacterized protein n=1 Tax=Methylomarinum roseum TaxID=3067653 RepID=A0AAU7NRX0_9GAMM|nr:hypothetical protein [Methylomarinum sp. Ch1-1]MDP4520284.1 hypothetical protein [Methylomarinum sp. Ch1-1]
MTDKIIALLQPLRGYTLSFRKILRALVIATLIIMPEEIFDLLFTLLEYAFEGFELLLEEAIQHFFHLNKADTQRYVFYILIALAAAVAVVLCLKAPDWWRRLKTTSTQAYQQQKEETRRYWAHLNRMQRILLVSVYLPLGLYITSFFII